jgi:hypothetical protein
MLVERTQHMLDHAAVVPGTPDAHAKTDERILTQGTD